MKDLTKGNLSRNLFMFALPSIISGFFSYAMGAVDQMMLGKLVGDGGLAAAGCTSGYFSIIYGIVGGMSMGFGIRLTYLVGVGNDKKTRQTMRTNTLVTLTLSLIVLVLTWALWRPIFSLLNVPADIYEEAKRYFLIFSLIIPCWCINDSLGRVYSAFGNSAYPMRVSLCVSAGNVVLNFLFIVVFQMGAAGAAIATIIVSYAGLVAYVLGLRSEFRKMGGELRGWHFSFSDYKPIWILALPCLLQQFSIYASNFVLQPSINSLGTSAIAAISAGSSISNLVLIAFQSSTTGLSVLAGQAIGHRQVKIIKRGMWVSARQILLLASPFIALLLIFPRLGAYLFLADPYGESATIVIHYMYVCVPCLLFVAYARLFHNFYRGVMKPVFNTVASVTQCVVRITVSLLLIPRIGYLGLFIGTVVSEAADLLACLALYWSKRWKTEKYRIAESAESESAEAASIA